jgi:hypothetical protein
LSSAQSIDDLAAAEQLWHEHHRGPIETPADEAGSLRIAWASIGYLAGLDGDRAGSVTMLEHARALDAAAHGKLTKAHIAAVARLAKANPAALVWVRTLTYLLSRQRGAQTPRKGRAAYDWGKDPRAWTAGEIRAWERDHPGWHFEAWRSICVNERGEWIR